MLETVAIILVVMWLLGMISSYTVGGYIHLLLAVALVTVIIRLIRGRDPLK
ncbi:MAG: lmo0937 family membrane protein [Undibacterium sp.]|nr:lmo0937 family membrane protein [Opitutaceae bacterium]